MKSCTDTGCTVGEPCAAAGGATWAGVVLGSKAPAVSDTGFVASTNSGTDILAGGGVETFCRGTVDDPATHTGTSLLSSGVGCASVFSS